MSHDRILAAVVNAAASASYLTASSIDESTTIDELCLDSLGIIEMTVAIEEELDLSIGCVDRVCATTVGCFVAVARSAIATRAGEDMLLAA